MNQVHVIFEPLRNDSRKDIEYNIVNTTLYELSHGCHFSFQMSDKIISCEVRLKPQSGLNRWRQGKLFFEYTQLRL